MSARVMCHCDSLLGSDCSNNQKHLYCGQVYSPPPHFTVNFKIWWVQFGEAYSILVATL